MLLKKLSVCAALVLACTTSFAQALYTMKISTPTIGDVNVEWMKALKKGVEDRTHGKLAVEIYPASQLGSMARTVDGVLLGTIEAAFVSSGFLVGVDPRYQVFDAIGLFDDVNHGYRVFSDPEVRKRMATMGAAKGFQPLTTFVHSPNVIVSRKPVRVLDDLKGMKVRTYPSPMQMEPLKKLGMSPIPMTLGDVLPALQNGTIDGAVTANTIVTALKYQDAAKNAIYLPAWPTIAAAIVNKAWLAKLPPEFRTILDEEVRKADAIAAAWGNAEAEKSRAQFAQAGGINTDMQGDQRTRFIGEVTQVLKPVIDANSAVKEDFRVFSEAASKHRTP